jgi:hypothetical protein
MPNPPYHQDYHEVGTFLIPRWPNLYRLSMTSPRCNSGKRWCSLTLAQWKSFSWCLLSLHRQNWRKMNMPWNLILHLILFPYAPFYTIYNQEGKTRRWGITFFNTEMGHHIFLQVHVEPYIVARLFNSTSESYGILPFSKIDKVLERTFQDIINFGTMVVIS